MGFNQLATRRILLKPLLLLWLCSGANGQGTWQAAKVVAPDVPAQIADPVAFAEAAYDSGLQLDGKGDARCIDYYFQAAATTWRHHAAERGRSNSRANELYLSALRQMVLSAARLGHFKPYQGIQLANGSTLKVAYQGFCWQPCQFNAFLTVGEYQSDLLRRRFVMPGVGAPLVVFREGIAPFMRRSEAFAATAVLRPAPGAAGSKFMLELYDPLRTNWLSHSGGAPIPVAGDITAPIAYAASNRGDAPLNNFLQPGGTRNVEGLDMIEPYQPGKIPLVFIHGLLSDPLTWADLANELRAVPEIVDRYQFWAFRYATGEPFLASAANLREQLVGIRQTYDPQRVDPAFSRTVLIGHSMGGIVAKLQVTDSRNALWQSFAKQPLSTVRTDEATRAALQRAFYFRPSPDVSRVIFIGTPHTGSMWASRFVGRLGSAMVRQSSEQRARSEQLLRDNPGVFRDELDGGIPTSIDLLQPSSPLLAATNRLPYRRGVQLHSIIGAFEATPQDGPTDGVVSVTSARLIGANSELFVKANHENVHRRDETVREVLRLLRDHVRAYDAGRFR